MDFKENIKNGVSFTVDTVSEIAAVIAEKNRLRCQLTHLKKLIKTDSATRDQAYVELGRFFYENLREGTSAENEAICAVIDASSERISKASLKYMELLNMQNELKIRSENAEKLKKIIADKAANSAKAAKEKGAELGKKAKDIAAQGVEKAKGFADGIKDKANDTVDDVKEHFDPESNAEVEQIIADEQAKAETAEPETVADDEPATVLADEPAAVEAEPETVSTEEPEKTEEPTAAEPAEESPDSFDF